MISRKVIIILMPNLTSALNIKTAMSDIVITMIKTYSGLGCCQVYWSSPCHILLFNRISEKELWLLL